MTYVSIAAGFVFLFLGGEMLVRGAVALAKRFDVSPLVIGLTIVGFGTSMPELIVSLNAALAGSPGLAVGNVVGSNLANMMLILGVAALICPIVVNPGAVSRDGIAMLAATVIFIVFGLRGSVGPAVGAAMVTLLVLYVGYSLWRDRQANDAAAALHREEAEEIAGLPGGLWGMILWVVVGIAALVAGAEWLVDGAVDLARAFRISDEVIGLTLVAVGTSLPELATSIVAAYRGHSDVCVGNVLGSNIFNLFGILGLTAIAVEVPFADRIIEFDLWVLLAVTVLLLLFMLSGRRLSRGEGLVLLALYSAYVASQFWGLSGTVPGV